MSVYTNQISQYAFNINKKKELEQKYEEVQEEFRKVSREYSVMLEAQRVLGVISEEHTNKILDYITGTINNALSKMFPNDIRRIYLKKKLHANQHTHINVILETSKGMQRDLTPPVVSLSLSSHSTSPHHIALIKPGLFSATSRNSS